MRKRQNNGRFFWKIAKYCKALCGFQGCSNSKLFSRNLIRINTLRHFGHRIVIPVVVGSSPIGHPKKFKRLAIAPTNLWKMRFQYLEDHFRKSR